MSLHAIDALEDAVDATRELLWPVAARRWVRLAVLAFFVAGVGGVPVGGNAQVTAPAGGDNPLQFFRFLDFPGVLVVALAAVAVVVALALLYVGSVMEFVLVDGLRTREPRPFRSFGRFRWPGTRLFGFRLALFAVLAATVALAVGIVVALAGPGPRLIGLVFAVPLLLVVLPLVLAVNGFTTVFVVPIALDTGEGVLASWRRLLGAVRADTAEFGAYLVFGLVLSVVGSAFVSTVAGLVGLVAALPLGAAGFVALFALGPSPLAFVLAVPLVVAALFVLLAVAAVVRVPVLVYLRYYAIYTLAGVTDHDLRPDAGPEPAVRRVD